MNTQDVKNAAAQLGATLVSERTDGVYDLLVFDAPDRQSLITALTGVSWERGAGDRLAVDVLRPFDRNNSW